MILSLLMRIYTIRWQTAIKENYELTMKKLSIFFILLAGKKCANTFLSLKKNINCVID